ncbi:unnamed protein product [Didymodactylos carnosus]|uniref:Tetratricopeptide repeat protein n=1 Tax=Didymodactylos carnosus TaxID=1234261 RepID=A0A814BYK5_9BILA|nr:unnamed protein product [Didymodactylos carnosus]CAF3711779.1 unnamed protein product [Didymodactylos carnosus]
MIEFCQDYYKNNELEQEAIKEYQDMYCSEAAIDCYTRNTFVFRLLNKAFRTEDIDYIYIFHCTRSNCASVIFELDIDYVIQKKPFVDIKESSNNKDEEEILFSMVTILKIKSVDFHTALSQEQRKQHQYKLKCLLANGPSFSKCFSNIGAAYYMKDDFKMALECFETSLLHQSSTLDLSAIYNNIAAVHYAGGDNDGARTHFNEAFDLGLKILPDNHPWILDYTKNFKILLGLIIVIIALGLALGLFIIGLCFLALGPLLLFIFVVICLIVLFAGLFWAFGYYRMAGSRPKSRRQ